MDALAIRVAEPPGLEGAAGRGPRAVRLQERLVRTDPQQPSRVLAVIASALSTSVASASRNIAFQISGSNCVPIETHSPSLLRKSERK